MKTMNNLITEISAAIVGGKADVQELAADILGGGWQTSHDGQPLESIEGMVDDHHNDTAFEVLAAAQYWASGWACWYVHN